MLMFVVIGGRGRKTGRSRYVEDLTFLHPSWSIRGSDIRLGVSLLLIIVLLCLLRRLGISVSTGWVGIVGCPGATVLVGIFRNTVPAFDLEYFEQICQECFNAGVNLFANGDLSRSDCDVVLVCVIPLALSLLLLRLFLFFLLLLFLLLFGLLSCFFSTSCG